VRVLALTPRVDRIVVETTSAADPPTGIECRTSRFGSVQSGLSQLDTGDGLGMPKATRGNVE